MLRLFRAKKQQKKTSGNNNSDVDDDDDDDNDDENEVTKRVEAVSRGINMNVSLCFIFWEGGG